MINLSTLTCVALVERADDYLDGTIGWGGWLNFRLHILSCPPCMAYLRQRQMTIETLRRLPGEPVPDEIRDGLMQAFREWSEHDSED